MSSYNYSYNVLINRLEAFAAGHFLIKRFTHGQIDLADQLQDDEYPFMHVVPEQIRPVDGGMQFDFLIMFADIPRDKEYKAEYQREVISDCVRLGQDLIAEVKNGLQLFGFDVQLVNTPTFEPFMEEQKNTVTGVSFTLSLEVPWDWSACDIPAIWSTGGSSTGGSGTGFGITLQTNGVNNGVQSLLNLVAGSNITITDNGDGSVTFDATGGGGTGAPYVSTEWNANHTTAFNNEYKVGDRVWYNGSVYACIANNDGINPSNPAYWSLQSVGYRLRQTPVDWNADEGDFQILNKPTLATVATTGDYNDLSNLPTIPAAQVNSDWNAVSGVAEILNKPTLAAVATSGDYNDLINTPAIPSGTVTSVGLSVPTPANAAFSVSGSPVTTSGTLAIAANGTSSQYIDGTGALQTMPTTGIKSATASGTDTYAVTITGVSSYIDGEAYLIRFTNGNTDASTLDINSLGAKTLYRNNDGPLIGGDIWDGAEMLCIYNTALNGFQCIGASPNSLFAYITNAEATTITKGQAVYAFSGTGNRMSVKLARANTDATSAQTIGVVYSDSIAANQKGIIIIQGYLTGLSLFPTSTWTDGDPIYLSPTTAGAFTNTKPTAPNHLVYCGILATASNGSSGRMYVRIQNGYEMDELHDVQSSGAVNNDVLYRDAATSLWKPAQLTTILGYTPVPNTRTISTTSPLSGGGDLSANRTLSIADAVADGSTKGAAAFNASDFNSASGVISLDYANGQKASALQPGFLTAADWTTFNSKVGTDSVIFASNPNISQSANSTGYWAITGGAAPNATENARVVVMPCAGTLKNLYIRIGAAQSSGGTMVFTLRKNAADTAITVTFANADGSNVTKSDTANSVSVNAGDTITIKGVNNAPSSASGTFVSFSIILERS